MEKTGQKRKRNGRNDRFIVTAKFFEVNRRKWPLKLDAIFKDYMLEHDLYSTSMVGESAAKLCLFFEYLEKNYVDPDGWEAEKHRPLLMQKALRRMATVRAVLCSEGKIVIRNGAFVKVNASDELPELGVLLKWMSDSTGEVQCCTMKKMCSAMGREAAEYQLALHLMNEQRHRSECGVPTED